MKQEAQIGNKNRVGKSKIVSTYSKRKESVSDVNTAFTATQPKKTKLARLLEERGLMQIDIQTMVYEKFGRCWFMGVDRICEIVNGKRKGHNTRTIIIIAHVLGVTPNDIIDYDDNVISDIKKEIKERAAKLKAKNSSKNKS